MGKVPTSGQPSPNVSPALRTPVGGGDYIQINRITDKDLHTKDILPTFASFST